jgi:NAD-reducing hydrogenase large subunit
MYRVGPLARLNVCERMGTPLADKELPSSAAAAGAVTSLVLYHHARLIEILAASN